MGEEPVHPLVRSIAARIALVLLAAAALSCQGDADFSDAMPGPVTLSAEAYQADIMDIDRFVFEETAFTKQRWQALSGKLESLSRRITQGSKSKFLKLESLELRRLAEMARRLPSAPPPPALTNNWMRLRNNLFEDRAWMARSARDIEPARDTSPLEQQSSTKR